MWYITACKTFISSSIMKRLFSLLICIFICCISSFAKVYHLQQLSVTEGLSQQDVECVIQDKQGCIWIGSYDGLNKYTGNSITVYRHNPKENSIIDNRIIVLENWSSRNEIWIGTEGRGLCSFNLKTEKFTSISDSICSFEYVVKVLHQYGNGLWFGGQDMLKYLSYDKNGKMHIESYSLPGVWNILSIQHDNFGNIIVCTDKGLYVKSPNSDNFQLKYSKKNITKIYVAPDGCLWLVAGGKLSFYNKQEQAYVDYLKFPLPVDSSIIEEPIQSICYISENTYLVNTSSNLYWMIKSNSTYQFERLEFYNKGFFRNNTIRSVYVDSTMNVWINSNLEGVAHFDLNQKNIYSLSFVDKQYDKRLFVQSIIRDQNNRLWIGTNNGIYVYKHDSRKMDFVPSIKKSIYGILNDSYGNMWFAMNNDLMVFPESDYKKGKSIFSYSNLPSSIIKRDGPYAICEDTDRKIIWIGLRSGILEIRNYDSDNLHFKHYDCSYFGLNRLSNITAFLLLPEYGSLLVTTAASGFFEASLNDNGDIVSVTPVSYKSELDFKDHIWSIIKVKSGDIFIGTDSGIRQVLRTNNRFCLDFVKNNDIRLQINKITALTEDSQNNLWLSTGQGLISLNLITEQTKIYTKADGLAASILTEGAYYDDISNCLFVGGYGGVSVVELSSLSVNEICPKTIIQNVRINNREIKTGENLGSGIILPFNINFLSEIELEHNENNISFDLASLHFSTPNKNCFAYKLEGFMDDWVEMSESNIVTFTNLPSGEYVFKAKSANGDGVWEKDNLSLKIKVKPPFWLTWWAFSLYILMALIIAYLIYRYYADKKKAEYMRYVENMEHNKKMELAEIKLRYHTNITHELRTPLSLIVAPIQELIDRHYEDSYLNMRLRSIKNNADRLLQLINQFLDLRKVAVDKYDLRVSYQRIDLCFSQIKNSFEPMAISNYVSLNLYYDTSISYCWCDREVINKICYNLISNALKYTSNNGQVNIYVSTDVDMKFLTISVEDTGEGISESELENIFDRFYQAPGAKGGTGIGLYLCKQLASLHHGNINVVSRKGEGTIFTVVLPIYKDAFASNEIVEEPETEKKEEEIQSEPEEGNNIKDERTLVLVVEDNKELREYLSSALIEEFDVVTAENGEIGYNIAVTRIPSIIISDIMMPVMDGMELLKKTKENTLTCHIPFILLTAKDSAENELEGLAAGADDYIIKPFSVQLIKYKIRNLVKLSANEKNDSVKNVTSSMPELTERDKKFVESFRNTVLENISSSEFGIEDLCRIMCISRMQLHRKTIAILSKKPSQIIKEIRMKKAFELISVQGYNISETMQEVGYTNHSYFSKLFIEVNGVSPRELMEKRK